MQQATPVAKGIALFKELGPQIYKELLDELYDGVYFVDRNRTILFWNKSAERLTGYRREEVIGSHCWDNILVHVDSQGRNLCVEGCPLVKTMNDGVMIEADVYLHHKDGHRVPVLLRATPLRDQEGTIIGAVEVFSDNSEKMTALQMIEELRCKAFLDPLTGLPNRRFLEMNLGTRFDEMFRYDRQFGLLMIDIDHFKSVNDRYGHEIGDVSLQMVARTMLNSTRASDFVGRWGGEEFLAVKSNANGEELQKAAERYRMLVEQSSLKIGNEHLHLTISIGATVARQRDTIYTLIKRVDELMYRSKAKGRNLVTVE